LYISPLFTGKSYANDHTERYRTIFSVSVAIMFSQLVSKTFKRIFQLFGRILSRAVKDSRMLDLPLSDLMCRVLLCEEDTFSFRDLFQLDAQLARSLQQLHTFAANDQADNVEELYLDFILPGTL